jgi:hypothetical protein
MTLPLALGFAPGKGKFNMPRVLAPAQPAIPFSETIRDFSACNRFFLPMLFLRDIKTATLRI